MEAVALAYWTDHPERFTADVPALNSSMKSFRTGAPELPPPPKTRLITTPLSGMGEGPGDGEGVGDGVGLGLGSGVGEGDGTIPGVGLLNRFCGSLGERS